MNIKDIESLAEAMETSDLTRCVITDGDETLRLVRSIRPAEADDHLLRDAGSASEPGSVPVRVRAPCSGNFRSTHPLRPEAAASEGAVVSEGQNLGYMQIESVLFPVTAPSGGRVGPSFVPEGALVGYGDALTEIAMTLSTGQ
ncbi:hypothetical protein P5W99_38660 [Paraburkholderia sp. A3BS-1L]|uniref:hypothetical protein n=1 Tax=Paraburkholderia sp. A3BS-1L TaxID=3028375 RepID=UPI003DA8F0CA